jgi:ABC-2 type transport system ATP-binding protein
MLRELPALTDAPSVADAESTFGAIVTRDLTKVYGKIVAVDHLNLRVERGETFGFLGLNGAGKTTTMRMLLGLIRPTSGSAELLGMDIRRDLPAVLARTGATIENPTFYPYLSGRDNLRFVARITGTSESHIPAILRRLDLQSAAHRPVGTYSMGMKQRLAVGAALLKDPELLVLDEPANGLDPAGIAEMRQLMQALQHEGRTVLISSHVLHEVEQICDRIAILNRGRVVVQGKVADLLGSRSTIDVHIASAAAAQGVLARAPWVREVTRDGDHLTVRASLDRVPDVIRTLGEHGLYPSEVRHQEQSLEQYFLDVTEGAPSWQD